MRIADLRARVVKSSIPKFEVGGGMRFPVELACVIVEVEDENGVVGRGETSWNKGIEHEIILAQSIVSHFKPVVVGEDAANTSKVWDKLWAYAVGPGLFHAVSGVDQAIWDLKARALGVPLHTLFGGKVRDTVNAYACSPVRRSIEKCCEDVKAYADLGFKATKLVVGLGLERDKKLVRDCSDAAGGRIRISVDANCAYESYLDAAELAQACDDAGIFWFEDPMPPMDLSSLARLNRRYRTPISGFQREIHAGRMKEYLRSDALEIYHPKLNYCGGVSQSLRVANLCDVWNKMYIPHGFGCGIKAGGTLQIIAATRNAGWFEFTVAAETENPRRFMTADYVKNLEALSINEDGEITVTDTPGNGIELDADLLKDAQIFAC